MLMGAAEGGKELKDQIKPVVFEEDLNPEERARILKEKTGVFIIEFFIFF